MSLSEQRPASMVATNYLPRSRVRDRVLDGESACSAYANIAFPVSRRICRVNPLVVYYHVVSDRDVPHVSNLYTFRNVSQFRRDLDVLLRFFHPLSLQEFLLCLDGKQALPRNSFLLTFDDGLRECYEIVAPILKQKGIPATFFLCSAFVDNRDLGWDFKKSLLLGILKKRKLTSGQEGHILGLIAGVGIPAVDVVSVLLSVDYRLRAILDPIALVLDLDFSAYLLTVQPYLTSDQIVDLLKGDHAVGGHSIDHPRYGDLPLAEQLHQTRQSMAFVTQRFSVPYRAFAFPSSDAKVSKEFFRQIARTGEVEVWFGNHGLMDDCVPRNVQRVSMEKSWMPAEAILGKNYARRFLRLFSGRLIVERV